MVMLLCVCESVFSSACVLGVMLHSHLSQSTCLAGLGFAETHSQPSLSGQSGTGSVNERHDAWEKDVC